MDKNKYDYLIVGSGLFGATFAYFARKAGKRCLVIDKRSHLGGNVYCEQIPFPLGEGKGEACINVHKYGAHIFHTNNKEVWDFVNSLVEFNRYTNSPVANYKGELYNLPFNMNTFCQLWPDVHTPAEAKAKIAEQVNEAVMVINQQRQVKGLPLLTPSPSGEGWGEAFNLEEQALCLVGKDIFEKLIKEYTEKQWGRDCKDLPAFIIKRLPVRFVFDNNYFNDRYQGIPIGGYNVLINKLLEGVDTKTDCDFFAQSSIINQQSAITQANWRSIAKCLVYTGPIDEYFNYRLGRLDWRTVTFKTRVEDTPNYQGNAVINYTSHDEPYTRVIEHKHFEMFGQQVYDCPKTVISEEYPAEFNTSPTGGGRVGAEPYYPVNDDKNNALVAQYRALAHQQGILFPEDLNGCLTGETNGRGLEGRGEALFGGRLAEYKYYDMAPIIEQVMKLWLS